MSRKSQRDRFSTDNLPVNVPELDAQLTLPPKRYCPHVPTPNSWLFCCVRGAKLSSAAPQVPARPRGC